MEKKTTDRRSSPGQTQVVDELGGTGHWPVWAGYQPGRFVGSVPNGRLEFFSDTDSSAGCRRERPCWPFHPKQSAPSRFIAALLGLAISLISVPVFGADVKVYAAASLADALKEIAPAFEKATGDKLIFNLGASSLLARQIEEGAPADVFFSADEARMNELEGKGLIVKDTRRSLLSNSLVVVVATIGGPTVTAVEDLAGPKIKRIALAETRTVPAGIYAKEFLEKEKLWMAVAGKVVPTENVRGALAAVESGNVDAAIVYKTDAAISKQVKVALEISASDGPKISYPVAIMKETKQIDAARRFLKHLESDDATKIFRKHGFLILKRDGTTP